MEGDTTNEQTCVPKESNTAEFEKILRDISFDHKNKNIPRDKRRFTEQVDEY